MRRLALASIRIYQLCISPYLGGYCRHIPNCSQYAYEAISKYGVLRGVGHSVRRLSRCRPMGTRGYDQIP